LPCPTQKQISCNFQDLECGKGKTADLEQQEQYTTAEPAPAQAGQAACVAPLRERSSCLSRSAAVLSVKFEKWARKMSAHERRYPHLDKKARIKIASEDARPIV